MSSLAWVVGAWSMLVSIVAPTPQDAPLAASQIAQEVAHEAQSDVRVSATGYTCAYHPNNRMATTPGMCEVLANGSRDVFSRGMACPRSWMGQRFEVPGQGILECDDTGAYDEWDGLPHIDIRFGTWDAAWTWGKRVITITEVR